MTLLDREEVGRAVRDRVSVRHGIATLAALEVAAKYWTKEDTIIYGTRIAALIQEED